MTPHRTPRASTVLAALTALLASLGSGAAHADELDEADAAAPEPVTDSDAASADAADSGLVAALGFGAGVSGRSVRLPTQLGERRLDTGLGPGLDLSLSGEAPLGSHWLLGALFRYQTSLGLQGKQTPPAGTSQQSSLRTHHVELGLTPGVRFGRSASSASLRLFAGWAVRGLRAVVDVGLPPYTLHGPVLRPELRIPIAGGAVTARLAPELLVIAGVTGELRHLGSTASAGLGIGGEAALDIRLTENVDLVLSYRESRATIATSWSADFLDNERFATARVVLHY